MKRISGQLFSGILIACLVFTCVYAADENIMYDFYNGLANIIEQNMNNPDNCVTQAENHIRANIAKLKEVVQKAKQMARTMPQAQMSQAELEQKMQALSTDPMANKMMDTMQRFSQALYNFSEKYPDHAEKIGDVFDEFEDILKDTR
jgi:DNA repair ATPase RecN